MLARPAVTRMRRRRSVFFDASSGGREAWRTEGSVMQCLRCRTENREGLKFCEDCGASLGVTCSRCGAEITRRPARRPLLGEQGRGDRAHQGRGQGPSAPPYPGHRDRPRHDGHRQLHYANTEERGDVESRLRELHHGLEMDRTSCSRFWANQFRVLLTLAAYVLF
jgi:hypothetical protein